MSAKRKQRIENRVVTPFPQRINAVAEAASGCSAMRLLHAEHQSMIELLHDDLGQNLVAIRSFAAALAERHADAGDDSAELAAMIGDAADSAYRRSYDLMQELRAQHGADRDLTTSFDDCLREARLQEYGIASRYRVDQAVGEIDRSTHALVLRNLRTFISFCRALGACEQISVDLQPALGRSDRQLELVLRYGGQFEQLDSENPSLRALAERTGAIGGEIMLGCDAGRGEVTLNLYFDPLISDCGIRV